MAKKIFRKDRKVKEKVIKFPVYDKNSLKSNIYDLVRCASQESTRVYVKTILSNNGIKFYEDTAGNIFNLDNVGVPLLSAHMDTVGLVNDYTLAYQLKEDSTGIISTGGVCGGDDKCGIHIILNILTENEHKINFIFSTDEEIGCLGIKHFLTNDENTQKLEDNCLYCLVLDRKGDSDIICYLNYYGTKEFDEALQKVSDNNFMGFNSTVGLFSDADYISDYVSTANISVGYYNPHTSKEYIDIFAMDIAEDFVKQILTEVTEKYEPVDAPFSYGYSGYSSRTYGSKSWYYGYDDYTYPGQDDYDYLYEEDDETKKLLDELLADRNGKGGFMKCDSCGGLYSVDEMVPVKTFNLNDLTFKFCTHCAFDIYDELGRLLKNTDYYGI